VALMLLCSVKLTLCAIVNQTKTYHTMLICQSNKNKIIGLNS